jgi:hypothetical protein
MFLLELPSWEQGLDVSGLRSEHFCLLIAGDAEGVAGETILAFAGKTLKAGCVYACVWGPGCEFVHDRIDDRIIETGIETDDDSVVMTTWHDDESLEEALEFLVYTAVPGDAWNATCRASLVAVIGNEDWAAEVRRLIRTWAERDKA